MASREKSAPEPIDPIDLRIGKRMKFRRNFMGLTQETLAREIGVSFQQIQKYESGQNKISASKLYHLSLALKSPVSFFFEDETQASSAGMAGMSDQEQSPFDHSSEIDTAESAMFLRAYTQIVDKKKRKVALEMLKGLSS
jgi:transcriptional regulator with XRE-family HTH domain